MNISELPDRRDPVIGKALDQIIADKDVDFDGDVIVVENDDDVEVFDACDTCGAAVQIVDGEECEIGGDVLHECDIDPEDDEES